MPERLTHSSRGARDGPSVNGSFNSADNATATLLLDQPAEPDIEPGSGQDHADTTTEPGASSAAASGLSGQVQQPADQPGSTTQTPDPAPAEEDGKLVGEAKHQPVGGSTPLQSDPEQKPGAHVQKIAGGLPMLLERRGIRSTLLGVVLVGVAVALGAGSVVSVALLIVGVVMLIVGLIGRRLQGRFAIEFGPNGASIEMQTHMASPGRTQVAGPLAPWQPARALIAYPVGNASPTHDAAAAAISPAETI